jgi:hypothetical protein
MRIRQLSHVTTHGLISQPVGRARKWVRASSDYVGVSLLHLSYIYSSNVGKFWEGGSKHSHSWPSTLCVSTYYRGVHTNQYFNSSQYLQLTISE